MAATGRVEDRSPPSREFTEQNEWQDRTYHEVAIEIANELDRRGNLHHQIRQLTLADLTRIAYVAVGAYADRREKRRQELEGDTRPFKDWSGA